MTETPKRKMRATDRVSARIRGEFIQKKNAETVTINVSRNGVFVKESSERGVNSLVRLRLFLPPDQKPIEIFGRVAWKGKVNVAEGVGIHFLNLESNDRKKWLEFISEVETLNASIGPASAESVTAAPADPSWRPEQRASARSPASFIVRFRTMERLQQFLTANVSQGGMFLKTPVLRPVGERVQVVIIHPDTDTDFEIEAEVAHVNETPTTETPKGMGLKFVALSPEVQKALDGFLKGGKD